MNKQIFIEKRKALREELAQLEERYLNSLFVYNIGDVLLEDVEGHGLIRIIVIGGGINDNAEIELYYRPIIKNNRPSKTSYKIV